MIQVVIVSMWQMSLLDFILYFGIVTNLAPHELWFWQGQVHVVQHFLNRIMSSGLSSSMSSTIAVIKFSAKSFCVYTTTSNGTYVDPR